MKFWICFFSPQCDYLTRDQWSDVNRLLYLFLFSNNLYHDRYCTGSESNSNDLPMCNKGKYCPRQTAAGKELGCPKGGLFIYRLKSKTFGTLKIVTNP